jgi:hypothetical protein
MMTKCGRCPKCGAPIYHIGVWMGGGTLPPPIYTCPCCEPIKLTGPITAYTYDLPRERAQVPMAKRGESR